MHINDLSVKKKLFIIYFTALLIPMLIINLMVLSRYRQSIRQQYYESNQNELDFKAKQINDVLDNGYFILQKFYSDRVIYRILDKKYVDHEDFVTTYNDLFNSTVLSFIPFYEDVQSLIFYTTNTTILNAGSIRYISERIRNQQWYSSQDYDPQPRVISWVGSNQDDRNRDLHLSIVSPLNYYSSYDQYERLMKVDLKLSLLSNIVSESANGGFYRLQDNHNSIDLISGTDFSSEDFYKEKREILDASGEVIWNLYGYYPEMPPGLLHRKGDQKFLLLGFSILIYSTLIILLISRSLTLRMNLLTNHLHSQDSIKIPLANVKNQGKDEIGQLINSYNQMSRRINQLVHDVHTHELGKKQVELERKTAELHALQSQVSPHYLFNTLETIRMKSVLKGEGETAEILQLLSASYRRMISWEYNFITVEESIHFLKDYLEIQKYTLGSSLMTQFDISEEVKHCYIPKMILQPFVENSCRHGLLNRTGQCRLLISIQPVEGRLQIIIEDNGAGMEQGLIDEILQSLENPESLSKFVGIRNTYSRLKSYFEEASFDIISRPNLGTRTVILIDKKKKGEY